MKRLQLTNNPFQLFTHEVDGRKIRFELSWNSIDSFWAVTLFDGITGDIISAGLAIVTLVDLFSTITEIDALCIFISKNQLIKNPDRNGLSEGFLYIGVLNAV